jgi:hypothetical protein
MFSTNVTGLIAMTQSILPILTARNSGTIINIGSIAGREPYPGGSIYCATKAAVRSFTDAMRKELIATRIRIIEIDPGQVETEFSVVRFDGDREKAKKVYEGVEPLTGEDVAEVVVFAAGRRENVVLADTLVFPNHQVSKELGVGRRWVEECVLMRLWCRLLRRLCIGRRRSDWMLRGRGRSCRYWRKDGVYTSIWNDMRLSRYSLLPATPRMQSKKRTSFIFARGSSSSFFFPEIHLCKRANFKKTDTVGPFSVLTMPRHTGPRALTSCSMMKSPPS